MTPADEYRLREAYRRESRSLLQYAGQAELYAGGADRKLLDAVRRVAAEDADHLRGFADMLAEWRVTPPHPGAFPMAFTDLNFVSVRWLLPKLVADRRRAVADLTADADAVADPAARAALDGLLRSADRHRAELESLGPDPSPAGGLGGGVRPEPGVLFFTSPLAGEVGEPKANRAGGW